MDPDSKRRVPAHARRPARPGPRSGDGLAVSVSDGRGRRVPDGGLARWLAAAAPPRARGEVAIALVTDAHIQTLNRRYRRKDAPTDVLSFPAGDSGDESPPSLGDIVIARGLARRQAKAAGHSVATELRVLALHGLLHLLGYDHDSRHDAGRMARVEARLRRKAGLPSGLIERNTERPPRRGRR